MSLQISCHLCLLGKVPHQTAPESFIHASETGWVCLHARVEVVCQPDQVVEYSDCTLSGGISVKLFLEELCIWIHLNAWSKWVRWPSPVDRHRSAHLQPEESKGKEGIHLFSPCLIVWTGSSHPIFPGSESGIYSMIPLVHRPADLNSIIHCLSWVSS